MKLQEINESFRIDVGAPVPVVLSSEYKTYLIFYTQSVDPNWDGTTVHHRDKADSGVITIEFERVGQYKFGSPNDEAIDGHPYYSLGLRPYSIFEVEDSDWIEQLRRMNSVHPYHRDEVFDCYHHYIFFFHDSCFEIVCYGYEVMTDSLETMKEEVERISKLLN